jgi:hypothetical protein
MSLLLLSLLLLSLLLLLLLLLSLLLLSLLLLLLLLSANASRVIFQALLLCKYPIAGVSCTVELSINPRSWGMSDCREPTVVMTGENEEYRREKRLLGPRFS